jgi:hypothetical protein
MEIYKITNCLNSKIYIGKDTTSNPKYYGSGVILNNAIKKYGIENFVKEVIDTAETKEDLSKKEKNWIEYYNSTDKSIGYNISKGGDGGDTISNNPNRDIIAEKLSESSPVKGKTYEEAYGKEKAEEYKNKLSQNHASTKHRKGKTYEEIYGKDLADLHKQKLKQARSKYKSEIERIGEEKYKMMVSESRERFLGENNPMRKNKYIWYHNPISKEQKRFIEGAEIPANFIKGKIKKERNKESIILGLIEKISEKGIMENIEEIKELKKNRNKLGFKTINEFYDSFGIFEEGIKKYYSDLEFINRSNSHSDYKHTKNSKEKIRQSKIERARKDLEDLIEIINSKNIEELEDYFSEADSKNIRKRFLKGAIKNEVPDRYRRIIKKKRFKKAVIPPESLKSMEQKLGKKIEIDGIEYDSISGAAKELGIDRNWVRCKVSTGKWPAKYKK